MTERACPHGEFSTVQLSGAGASACPCLPEQRYSCFSMVHPVSVSGALQTWLTMHTLCMGTEQTSHETERSSSFWKRIQEISPHSFLQHAQRLIGNGKAAAIKAAGPNGEPASEPALRFSFLLTQGQTLDRSVIRWANLCTSEAEMNVV